MSLDKLNRLFADVIPENNQEPVPVQRLRTGIMPLDWAMCGGLPRGRISVFWGPEGSGKTGLMINPILEAQRSPVYTGNVLYIDLENKVDERLFYRLGVDPGRITFARTMKKDKPLTGYKAMTMIRAYAGVADLIVVDSIPGMVTDKMYEDDSDTATYGAIANLLSKHLPIVSNILPSTKTSLVMINQSRASMETYGDKVKQYGGFAVKFYPAVIVRMRKSTYVGKDNSTTGFKIFARVEKNSLGKERRVAEWAVSYADGVDRADATFETAKVLGVVNARNCKVGDVCLNHPGQHTIDDAKARLREEPDLLEFLIGEVLKVEGSL